MIPLEEKTKAKSLDAYRPRFFYHSVVIGRKRTSQQCGKNDMHQKRSGSVTSLSTHHTKEGQGEGFLKTPSKRAQTLKLAVPELNCL